MQNMYLGTIQLSADLQLLLVSSSDSAAAPCRAPLRLT